MCIIYLKTFTKQKIYLSYICVLASTSKDHFFSYKIIYILNSFKLYKTNLLVKIALQ